MANPDAQGPEIKGKDHKCTQHWSSIHTAGDKDGDRESDSTLKIYQIK